MERFVNPFLEQGWKIFQVDNIRVGIDNYSSSCSLVILIKGDEVAYSESTGLGRHIRV